MLTQKIIGGDKVYQGAKGAILIGKFGNSAGYGVGLSSTRTGALKVHADDQGIIKSSGTMRAIHGRMLLTAVNTGGTYAGVQGQIKSVASATAATPHWACGVWGYAEAYGTNNVQNLFGVRATVDCPSGVTIASGGRVAGLCIDSIYMGGTHTGKAAMIYVPNSNDGEWDYFLDFGSAPGAIVADTSSVPGSATHKIKCRIGSTDFYLIGVGDF